MTNERTSEKMAELASSVLNGYKPTQDEIKSLAGSVLTQVSHEEVETQDNDMHILLSLAVKCAILHSDFIASWAICPVIKRHLSDVQGSTLQEIYEAIMNPSNNWGAASDRDEWMAMAKVIKAEMAKR